MIILRFGFIIPNPGLLQKQVGIVSGQAFKKKTSLGRVSQKLLAGIVGFVGFWDSDYLVVLSYIGVCERQVVDIELELESTYVFFRDLGETYKISILTFFKTYL